VSLCVAVAYEGDAIESTDPWSAGATWTTVPIANEPAVDGPMLTAVSCRSASFCLATSRYGNAIVGLGGVRVGALLGQQIMPPGSAADTEVLIRRHGFTASFQSPTSGTLSIEWLLPRSGRRPLGRDRAPEVLARAHAVLEASEPAVVHLTLTAKGLAVFRHAKHPAVTGVAILRPAGLPPMRVVHTFVLHR
jgi:hypothetical protein